LNAGDIESMGILGGLHQRRALDLLDRGSRDKATESFQLSKDTYERAVDVDPLDVYSLVNVGALTFVTGPAGVNNPAYSKVIKTAQERA
jgi:hypothetical protein